ncbi:cora-domain-containing protein [Polyporus arcularius HHB13444]|uniref:Cora-domain-containing protein n=2 Tax=Polyporaceae TaxID=5317 RepID=A0A5C3PM63_9APHY|nr:cora-domain-containing protein [Polyporus brumalis]TFK90874.1 cora-domain-containing protein [Polyporus arcularius HHB13444]
MYQAAVERTDRPEYQFGLMEDYAREEKTRLGLSPPVSPPAFDDRQPQASSSTHIPIPSGSGGEPSQQPTGEPASQDSILPFTLPRARHRKLSASSPAPRRGKMALFEQGGAPPPALASRAPHLAEGTTLSAVPSYDNLADSHRGGPDMMGFGGGGGPGSGHDRPYRFSFYSNALPSTIHARSLSELPADGQAFEDLFFGRTQSQSNSNGNSSRPSLPNRGALSAAGSAPHSGSASPVPPFGGAASGISKGMPAMPGDRRPGDPSSSDHTWWLDVLAPTDEEMKLLSKVFCIHPLTTEDIQMEETREKIELFRNYYLVCFRSFDQDPYSPTHLEPLNMYIIVFRDGIISFHFRPTPHPQNVRRRIKQLKDYISVTSDWISYALIDDITDAFGPLIQNIEYEVDSIDELVLILKEAEQSDMLRRIGTCRKKVMGLLRLMGNKADVVKGLAKRCNENWRVAPTSDIGLYLSDIQDHLITMTQNLNHYEKILSRSHSNYLAQISIEMTDANNQINDVLSKLTALGTVLIPMNLVTGLWGMNVRVPGQDVENLKWFGSIIAVLTAFAVVAGWSTYKLMQHR